MDIDRVRYFHTFVETGSLVDASEILHISQPALSKALKKLEQEVGLKLLAQEGRGLKLTPAGHNFKKETSSLLQQWLAVSKKIKLSELRMPLKIGSFEVFTTYFLSKLIHSIDFEALELYEFGPGQLETAIADGIIDVGITYVPIPKAGVEFIEITKINMSIFGLKKFKAIPLSELPFVIPLSPVEGTPSKVTGLDGWPDHKHQRVVKYRVTMMESALELCRQGLCVAYLPQFVIELHNKNVLPELRLVEYKSPISNKDRMQSVFIVKQKQTEESDIYRNIAKCLRSLS